MRRPKISHLVFGLLFFPHVVLLYLRDTDKWWRGLIYYLIMCIIGVAMFFIINGKHLFHKSSKYAKIVKKEFGNIQIKNDKIIYEKQHNLPHKISLDEFLIETYQKNSKFSKEKIPGLYQSGIWTNSQKVFFWQKDEKNKIIISDISYNVKSVINNLNQNKVNKTQYQLLFKTILMLILISKIPTYFLSTIIYPLIFTTTSRLFKNPLFQQSYSSTLTFFLYTSLLPLFVAGLYSSIIANPNINFSFIYLITIIIYQLIVFYLIRRTTIIIHKEK